MVGPNGHAKRRAAGIGDAATFRCSLFAIALIFVTFFVFSLATSNLLATVVLRHFSTQVQTEPISPPIDPVVTMPSKLRKSSLTRKPFHVAMTASDSPYSRWQCRIMYYWFKKVKNLPGSEMGGFTRILHSGHADNLMREIPTMVVDPLPPGFDRGYVVLNRPWAFVQWLQKAKIKEEYVLMAEPDHVFVKPLPNLARGDLAAAFPFFYIKPKKNEKILRKYYPEEKGPVTNIDPIGNSPVIIKKVIFFYSWMSTACWGLYSGMRKSVYANYSSLVSDNFGLGIAGSLIVVNSLLFNVTSISCLVVQSILKKIAPTWMNVSIRMKDDRETDEVFGWVLEMYGYAVASALHGVQHILRKDFMVQPPYDFDVGRSFIIHYTYANDFSLKGELIHGQKREWRFDKRSYLYGPLPRNISLPPPGVPESVVTLVKKLNEATATIPGWDEGR